MKTSGVLVGMGLFGAFSSAWCGAQQMPVALTLHITGRTGEPVGNQTIGIANGADAPFSRYRSDAQGNVTIVLAPGSHDLRIEAHGLPVAAEHVDLSAAETLKVALGRKAAPAPEHPAPAKPRTTPTPAPARATVPAHPARAATRAPAPKSASSPQRASNPLQPYTSCFFPDGLEIASVDALAPEGGTSDVETAQGVQHIDLVAGDRVLFSYPFTDFFANVKVEELPENSYAQEKQALLANLHYLEAQPGGPAPARALPANLHGFEVRGNNRPTLEGSVLGMYLIFDNSAHMVSSVLFLNQESWRRKFQTMDEYERLRDRFLTTYTGCVRENHAIEK
ncbi:MAG TPA: carboxypeptidase-like regulatory domain-containing protein [Acidobacteriaceae bacterium]